MKMKKSDTNKSLLILVNLGERYTITSNRESGFGRYDVMLEPLSDTDDAIILEFKVHDPEVWIRVRREDGFDRMRNRFQDRAGIEAAEVLIPAAIRDGKVLPFSL